MVRLVLDDVDQISMLELELHDHKIPYERVAYHSQKIQPLQPPYLLVHGVPLDFERSLKWIKEQSEHE